jgi:hypothetical protein
MSKKPLATIRIKIQTRRDGAIYITSDDMPGLWLWGKDHEQVFRSIAPTIEELYKLNEGRTVKAREALSSRFARWFAQGSRCKHLQDYRYMITSKQ